MSDAAAQADLRAMIAAYWRPHAIACAASLGLAEAMGNASCDAGELAAGLGVDPLALRRFLRALTAIGLVRDEGDGRFSLTGTGACLAGDHPLSLKGMALHVATQLSPAFAQLATCVRTGAPPPGVKHGTEGFADFADNSVAAAYDFTRFSTIMDVGGGYGAVLATLLAGAPQARGCVVDLDHARAGAERLFAAQGVAERARFLPASFFDPLPELADAYLLKYIVHDWPDAEACAILARVGAAAAKSEGTVLLIERILPDQAHATREDETAFYGDMTMMLWNGRERTEAEFRDLLARGGLALTRTVPLSDNHFVIEARPSDQRRRSASRDEEI